MSHVKPSFSSTGRRFGLAPRAIFDELRKHPDSTSRCFAFTANPIAGLLPGQAGRGGGQCTTDEQTSD